MADMHIAIYEIQYRDSPGGQWLIRRAVTRAEAEEDYQELALRHKQVMLVRSLREVLQRTGIGSAEIEPQGLPF